MWSFQQEIFVCQCVMVSVSDVQAERATATSGLAHKILAISNNQIRGHDANNTFSSAPIITLPCQTDRGELVALLTERMRLC